MQPWLIACKCVFSANVEATHEEQQGVEISIPRLQKRCIYVAEMFLVLLPVFVTQRRLAIDQNEGL